VQLCELQNFTEPYEFAASINDSKVDLTLLERGRFFAGIMDINLGSLKIKRISENLPRIMHWTNNVERATFAFHTGPGPAVIHDGIEVKPDNFVRAGTMTSHFQRSFGPVCWSSFSLPVEDVIDLRRLWGGSQLALPANEQTSVSRPAALANIQRLQAVVEVIAREAPEMIENPNTAQGLEQTLKLALGACLADCGTTEQASTRRQHQKIMRRFHTVLDANAERPLYVLEIAKAVGASVRSLTACCHDYLGMGPKKYLMLRRMHLARQALLLASPSTDTVTDAATQYGFWQFGRFAGRYKDLFGELPSVTLRKARATTVDCKPGFT
jgi:AraC-like DNA-binding protein